MTITPLPNSGQRNVVTVPLVMCPHRSRASDARPAASTVGHITALGTEAPVLWRATKWRSVKYEEVYLHGYANGTEAHTSLTRYFSFYNERRSHQSLEYRTPDDVYFSALAASTQMAA